MKQDYYSSSITIVRNSQRIFLCQLALRFDVPFNRLLWAVSSVFIKFAIIHIHCDVWGMHNNLHAWAEYYPVTLIKGLPRASQHGTVSHYFYTLSYGNHYLGIIWSAYLDLVIYYMHRHATQHMQSTQNSMKWTNITLTWREAKQRFSVLKLREGRVLRMQFAVYLAIMIFIV